MPAPATLPPPQTSGSARSSACKVPAPPVPEEVNIAPTGLGPAQTEATALAVESIFNAMMYMDYIEKQSGMARFKAWNNGPFGQDDYSLRALFGDYSDDTFAVAKSAIENIYKTVLVGRQPLTVKQGKAIGYTPDGKVLTVPAFNTANTGVGTGALQIIKALAAASGMRKADALVSFIHNRQGAGNDCLVSTSQA